MLITFYKIKITKKINKKRVDRNNNLTFTFDNNKINNAKWIVLTTNLLCKIETHAGTVHPLNI